MRDYEKEIVRVSGGRLRRSDVPEFPDDMALDCFDPKKEEPEFGHLDASYHINIPFAVIESEISAFTSYFLTFFLHRHRPIHEFVILLSTSGSFAILEAASAG